MQTKIIPTILVKTFEEVKERIRLVENYVDWVQLDIMDGVFVENKTWDDPNDLKGFETRVKLEAHLMVQEPEKIVDAWLDVVDRIIVHQESTDNIQGIIEKTHKKGKEIGIALNPETHPTAIEQFLNDIDLVLLMSVEPGWGGQEFKELILEKADFLKQKDFKGNIEIDGGINEENVQKVFKRGINLFCVGTYIFESDDIKSTIQKLKQNVT